MKKDSQHDMYFHFRHDSYMLANHFVTKWPNQTLPILILQTRKRKFPN
jgi:hypothetical protein